MLTSKKVPLDFVNKNTHFKKFHKIKLKRTIKYSTQTPGYKFLVPKIEYFPIKRVTTYLKIIKPSMKKISRRSRLRLISIPTETLTRKAKDIRMGRGKGAPTDRVAIVGDKPLLSLYARNQYKVKKLLNICKLKVHKSKIIYPNKW